jgi:hypothetical protein
MLRKFLREKTLDNGHGPPARSSLNSDMFCGTTIQYLKVKDTVDLKKVTDFNASFLSQYFENGFDIKGP